MRERRLKNQAVCNFQRCHWGAHLRNGPMNLVETIPKDRGTVLAEERTDLALRRTMIAAERTLMAWIRTALSMIGFGFSIYKFFQYLPEEIAAGNIRRPQAPRNLGMSLIALGTLALSAAAWQHRNFLKQIGASQARHVWSISVVVAIAVILIGIITFYGVLLRHGPF
jgi:putative membrane protein